LLIPISQRLNVFLILFQVIARVPY